MDIFDMKPNFDTMSKAELRAYVLAHRNDQEAFHKLVDRFKADSKNQVRHPFPQSLEDLARVQELIQEAVRKLEEP
jgi:putative heme degradation protein